MDKEAENPQLDVMTEPEMAFRRELEGLINRHSKENGSDTPDFILAEYLDGCLRAFDAAVNRRQAWYAPPQPEDAVLEPCSEPKL